MGSQRNRWDCAATGADVVAGHRECVVMLAVLAGRTLLNELMEATCYSRSPVHQSLVKLRDLGLVDWADGKKGTLRPTAVLVA